MDASWRREGHVHANMNRPTHFVDTPEKLEDACRELAQASVVGLDVETTTSAPRVLCLIQIAAQDTTYLIDALALRDLSPLATLLASDRVVKVAHNASFERTELGKRGLRLSTVVDTLALSRNVRGYKVAGGHGLAAVCERELGLRIDKELQTSDWSRRPLTAGQIRYAARDAEVLLRLWVRLKIPLPATVYTAYWQELSAAVFDESRPITPEMVKQLALTRAQAQVSEEQKRAIHTRVLSFVLLGYLADDKIDGCEAKRLEHVFDVLSQLGWAPGRPISHRDPIHSCHGR